MGAKDSKPSCISYEDAIKRISEAELRRVREAFKRSAGSNGAVLSKQAFIHDVLCEGVPQAVADWLYNACGGTAKGIAFKELICGLVLLTRGTQDEKIKFLWTLYCNDSGSHIIKQDFLRSLQLETTYQNNTCVNTDQIGLLFINNSDKATFDQFRSWIHIHQGATILSKWLLVESCVNLSSELETPTFYQSLAGVTHLEEQDIGELEKAFWTLKNSAGSGQLDGESLGPLLSPPVPRGALSGLLLAFDENRDGHIDFKELCCGVSAACRGPTVERTKFCFKIFDTDRDGVLNEQELTNMLDILIFVANENKTEFQSQNVTTQQVLKELSIRANTLHLTPNSNNARISTDSDKIESTQNVDSVHLSQEMSITQEEFLMWSVESELHLTQPFLQLLFEVCHVVLGLRPQCCHQENEIVRGWMSREVRRGYKVGQFWFLISAEWWQHWRSYTSGPCTCKGSQRGGTLNAVDEAMICDESFTSNSTESMGDVYADNLSLGSGSSGISSSGSITNVNNSNSRKRGPPGPIDNSSLIAPPLYKVQTLTGEGGRLKRDTTLSQHRDFELVPDSLWKALAHWHRGPIPLPRQVIQPPNNAQVELELFPLNLRILRHQNQPNPMPQSWGGMVGGYGALSPGGGYSATPSVPQTPKRYLAYTAAFSRLSTVRQVSEFICQRLRLRVDNVRLWHVLGGSGGTGEIPCLLEEEHVSLEELMICDNDQILIEVRNKDLTWPEEIGALALAQSSIKGLNQFVAPTPPHPPGATGLHNLGNTCFMNAALQAVFNTKPLTQYFNKNMHMYELNSSNPLGTRGQIARRYGELCKEVWTGSARSVAPLKLRWSVTRNAPRFAGGGQHDSQELLEWLLDALHEDLNRVTDKSYSELKDSDGRADSVVAAEAWNQHLNRNKSIIIDLFYGQLKSKVTCQTCGHESVRFDPFSLLSLPLPMESYTHCEVIVILLNGSIPVKYGLRLNSDAKYYDLKQNLSKLCDIEPARLLITELAYCQIKCILLDDQKIKPATALELVAYEVPVIANVLPDCQTARLQTFKDIQRNTGVSAPISAPLSQTSRASQQPTGAQCSASPESSFINTKLIENKIDMSEPLSTTCSNQSDDVGNLSIESNNALNTQHIPCYIVALHRKLSRQDTYFLSYHKTRPGLFGVPLLIACAPGTTNKQLYRDVWGQVTRLLSPLPPTPPDQANHATDCDDSLGYEFPFTLRAVASGGRICALCPWPRFCRGCVIKCDDEPLLNGVLFNNGAECNSYSESFIRSYDEAALKNAPLVGNCIPNGEIPSNLSSLTTNSSGYSSLRVGTDNQILHISIDWDPTALHLRYQSTREKVWTEHSSVDICKRQQVEPIDLDYCLRAFTTEEKLEEKYHCSKCKGLQPATKKLQIWKLPPILIVHLKRFNFVNNKWVKSQKVVNFPFDNFDATAYLAAVPQETVLRHRELQEMHLITEETISDITENSIEHNSVDSNIEKSNCDISISTNQLGNKKDKKPSVDDRKISMRRPSKFFTRERLESTSLVKTPVVDGEFKDFHQHKLQEGQNPFDLKYQLYAVVSHSGMLNGGHYISYTNNPNGSWYCYNDSSCREVSPPTCVDKPNLDTSAAYILFYERKGLNYAPYLPPTDGKTIPCENLVENDDSETDLKKMCVIN